MISITYINKPTIMKIYLLFSFFCMTCLSANVKDIAKGCANKPKHEKTFQIIPSVIFTQIL